MGVTVERGTKSHVAHLRLHAGKLNLLEPAVLTDLQRTLTTLPDEIAVMTIAADGTETNNPASGLSGGIDLSVAEEFNSADGRAFIASIYEVIQAVRDFEGVTVCGCGEYALGAGFELALACDFRVATNDSALGLPEINVGIPTLIQGGLLVRLVGSQTAKELCYLGEPVSGERALELGLVNYAVADEAYEKQFHTLTERLAEKSPTALQLQARVFKNWRSAGLESGMETSVDIAGLAFDTSDLHEAMSAFLEDREPEFDGR